MDAVFCGQCHAVVARPAADESVGGLVAVAGGGVLDDVLEPSVRTTARPPRPFIPTAAPAFRWGFMGWVVAALVGVAALGAVLFYMLMRPETFTASDGAYSLEIPSGWHKTETFEFTGSHGVMDLALEAPNDSVVAVGRFSVTLGSTSEALPSVLEFLKRAGSGTVSGGRLVKSDVAFADGTHPNEVQANFVAEGVEESSRTAVVLESDSEMLYFSLICPVNFCNAVDDDFDDLLSSVELGD